MSKRNRFQQYVPDENGKRIVLDAIHAIHENEQEISEIQHEITDAQARYSRGMITREHFNEIVNESHHELEACIQFREDYYQLLQDYQKKREKQLQNLLRYPNENQKLIKKNRDCLEIIYTFFNTNTNPQKKSRYSK